MGWDFQIVQVTAAGTFGTVCVAFDWTSRRFFALKVLKERFAEHDKVLARSRDEATLLAAMDHPNILAVHDRFDVAGRPVILMEWVQGCSLADLMEVRVEGLPTAIALAILRQAATALEAVHRTPDPRTGRPMHIIHRDLKPSNLLLSLAGEVKVVDFGIARAVFDDKQSNTVSMVLGSRDYMAPERLDGQDDTPRIDVYALGLIAYELLTGQRLVLSLRPRVHAAQKDDALKDLPLVDCPEPLRASVAQLLEDMLRYEPTNRLDMRQLLHRLQSLQRSLGPRPDLVAFANQHVRPIFDANSLADPRAHEAYPELSFLDAIGPTPPGGDPQVDRRLAAFLARPGWETRVEELWTLLLLNPSWSPRPFLRWLDRRKEPWWQFWQQGGPTTEQKIALLRILACRVDGPEVRRRVERFRQDPDRRVRRLADALLTAEEITSF